MKFIWSTTKKFEICVAGLNLFLISFGCEEDLELIMEGRPWLFRRQLIVFDRNEPTEQMKLRFVHSPFWLKFGPCSPECDKKDLMHAIGSSFEGLIR